MLQLAIPLASLISISLLVPAACQITNGTQVFVVRRDENNNFQLVPQTNATRAPPSVTSRPIERDTVLTSSSRTRDSLIRQESMEFLQSMILGGKPGRDFPNYSRPPRTKFSCRQMSYDGGMFADTETGCQVYHVCHSSRKDTFMCPTGTLFNQAIMACDFWYNVNCESAASFYNMNEQLYHPYQSRRVALDTPVVRRTDRPIVPPVTSNSIPRPTFQVPVKPRQSPPSQLPSSTSTTSTTTTSTTTVRPIIPVTMETPRTRKPTTPRVRFVTTSRARTTEAPEDRDWVFAWLKQENGTRADKQVLPSTSRTSESISAKRMAADNLPLVSLMLSERGEEKEAQESRSNGDLSTSRTRISLVGVRRNRVTATTPTTVKETGASERASSAGGTGGKEGASTTHETVASTTPYSMTSSPLQQVTSASSTLLPFTSASREVGVTEAASSTASESKLPLPREGASPASTGKSADATTGTISGESNNPKVQSKQKSSWLFPLEFMGI